jgi:peptidoglycan/LPS O-acetylase OafA/YrhL
MPHEQVVSATEREKSRTFPAYSLHLDFIRGLAALVVFYGHLHLVVAGHGSIGNDSNGLHLATHPADGTALPHAAVIVFFVLSGYLVGGSVVRDLGRESFTWPQYALRRLTRLWTVLIPALTAGAIADYLTWRFFIGTRFYQSCYFTSQLHGWPSASNILRYLFFFQAIQRFPAPRYGTNGALWSLSSEFWYYALFPLLALCVAGKRLPFPVRALMGIGVAAGLWFVGARIGLAFHIWLFGVLAYMLPAKIPAAWQRPVNLALLAQFCLVLFVLRSKPVNPIVADTVLGLSFTLLLYGLLHRTARSGRSLYSHLAHTLSLPSYTLYACHIPMIVLVTAVLQNRLPHLFQHTGLAMTMVAVPVLAYIGLLYLLFERNTDRFRRLFERRLMQPKHSGAAEPAVAGN